MSNLADNVEGLIKKALPTYKYKREFYVLFQNTQLFFDFIIPELKILIEVQGQQHYTFNKFFHGTVDNFKGQVFRDRLKTEWVADSKFKLVVIKYDEVDKLTPASFKKIITKAI